MRRFAYLLSGLAATIATPALAQSHGEHQPEPQVEQGEMNHETMDHGSMDHGEMNAMDAPTAAPQSTPPASAPISSGPANAADKIWGEQAMRDSRAALFRNNGGMQTGQFLAERFETQIGKHANYVWNFDGFYGGDIDKIYIKTEGEGEFGEALEEGEVQLLWSHAIGPYFDLQTGIRQNLQSGGATHGVIGLQGLAPFNIHIDGAAFLSHRGDITARIEAEYDQRIDQNLVLQPRIEAQLSAQNVAQADLGSGLTHLETGLRLRYEISPQFAPYIGFGYEVSLGQTGRTARLSGEGRSSHSFIAGIRFWF